jgi:predicted nucleotidyltransferase
MDRARAEAAIADYFRAKPGIVAVYLYGSVAKGTARSESDVDIGVLYERPPEATLMAQPFADEAQLGQLLARPVQIIVMNQASPDLVHRILRDGILVLEQSPSLRISFEVRARNLYFDVLPMLRQYRARVSV